MSDTLRLIGIEQEGKVCLIIRSLGARNDIREGYILEKLNTLMDLKIFEDSRCMGFNYLGRISQVNVNTALGKAHRLLYMLGLVCSAVTRKWQVFAYIVFFL